VPTCALAISADPGESAIQVSGVLLILIEVMCGMGRTRNLVRIRTDGVRPTSLPSPRTCGGYQPLGAMLFHAQILWRRSSMACGFFQAMATSYMGTRRPVQAALAVVRRNSRTAAACQGRKKWANAQSQLQIASVQHPNVGTSAAADWFIRVSSWFRSRKPKAPFAPGEIRIAARSRAPLSRA